LARVLAHFGVPVSRTRSVAVALRAGRDVAVLVAAPDDYSNAQLAQLEVVSGRLVVIEPGTRAVEAVAPTIQPDPAGSATPEPDCADAGANAAGRVSFPSGTRTYIGGAGSCYGGAVVTTPQLAVLGSAALLQNDHLADDGVAALDVNVITDSRRLTSVVWLLPGADAKGSGPASVWDLFPPAAYRAFWWLIAVGALLALWRARRLGGVVLEQLPVVVRAAELVEGHGRLYARAGARDRAAAALRGAALTRLAHRLGLPRGASAEQVATVAAALLGRAPADVLAVLAGPAPADDMALARLARGLDELEADIQEGGARR
jgi:hypothetical protein